MGGKKPKTATRAANEGRSHGEYAYLTLRQELLNGIIPSGSRIVELEIARRLSISRTPVREALRRLESDGFIQRLGKSKLVATPTGPDDVGDVGLLRIEIDGLAARLTSMRATVGDWELLRRLLDSIGSASDDVSLNRAHLEFHRGIHAVAFSPRMFLFVAHHVLPHLDLAVNSGARGASTSTSLRSHTNLYRALSSGNVDRAVRAARAHAESGLKTAKSSNRAHSR